MPISDPPRGRRLPGLACAVLLAAGGVACEARVPWPPPPGGKAAERTEAEAAAVAAFAALRAAPEDEARIIWYGRRLGYLGRFEDAVRVYTRGLALHPRSAKLLRHRGHRFLSLERFDDAVADLQRAMEEMASTPDEVEPDGIPNERRQPTSTLHTNVWYHLGLARYCRGEFSEAVRCFRACLDAATNPDMECAARYWLFHATTRCAGGPLGGEVLRGVRADWDVIENRTYLRLLLLYRGDLAVNEVDTGNGDAVRDATLGYGLARWYLMLGDEAEGVRRLRALAAMDTAAFGALAARADLAAG